MKITIQLFLSTLLGLISMKSFAQQADYLHNFDNRIKTSSIQGLLDTATTNNVGFTISDIQTPSNGATDYIDLYYNVIFRLATENSDVNKNPVTTDFSLYFDYSIKGIDPATGQLTTVANSTTLTVGPEVDDSELLFQFGKRNLFPNRLVDIQEVNVVFEVHTINTNDPALESIQLSAEVEFSRYETASNLIFQPIFYSHDPSSTTNGLKENEAAIYWEAGAIPKPCSYELEWVHIPSHSATSGTNLEVDFTKNAVRVQTTKNYLPFNLLHYPGYIVVRGRSIRPILNTDSSALKGQFQVGPWNLDDRITLNTSAPSVLLIDYDNTADLSQLNWQYNATYANESKKKEVVNFFDGTQRERQASTLLNNSIGKVIIDATDTSKFINNISTVISQESYYNYNGEPIISVLPSPVLSSSKIGYQNNINYIEEDATTINKPTKPFYDQLGNTSIPKFSTQTDGAAQYYSADNQFINNDQKTAFIPAAEGYPYQRTEYMKDGSGRLKAQYGLGSDKALDDTKGTRYAYAKPTQPELERLFGANVGLADYYKKDISIDPNGTINIAYVNNKGQTVATSMAGVAEGRSNMLNIPFDSVAFTTDLIKSGADQFSAREASYELTYPIFVASSSVYSFDYGFDIAPYMACSNVDVCFDCRYQLTFQIIDQENNLVLEATDKEVEFIHDACLAESYTLDTINYALPTTNAGIVNGEIALELGAQKQYTIIKKLSILTNELTTDAQFYLDSSACDFKTLDYFVKQELNTLDLESCESDYTRGEVGDPCYSIREGLKNDFVRPNGAFVQGAQDTDFALPYIYDRLLKVSGCNDLAQASYTRFIVTLIQHADIDQLTTFAELEEKHLDYLIRFHPTYCQLGICEQYYTEESFLFDEILNNSTSAEDFTLKAQRLGLIDPSYLGYSFGIDSILSYTSVSGNKIISDTVLAMFDPLMQHFIKDSLITSFLNDIFPGDTSQPYYSPNLNNLIREACDFGVPISSRAYYQSYFTAYSRGCRVYNTTTNMVDSVGIGTLAKWLNKGALDGIVEDTKWEYYRSLYLNARALLMDDVLSSIVCFDDGFGNDTIYGEDGVTIINIVPKSAEQCSSSGIYYYPERDAADADLYYNYDHFTGTGGTLAQYWGKGVTTDSIRDTLGQQVSQMNSVIGAQLFQLLLADSCIAYADSSDFIDRMDSSIVICYPYAFLDTLTNASGSRFLTCDVWQLNLTPTIQPFRDYYQNPHGTSFFDCRFTNNKKISCGSFNNAHAQFITALGIVEVPIINSITDVNINNSKQQAYKNWLNNRLALNLSFRDYYTFAQNCTQDSGITVFGDTVQFEGTAKEKSIREALVNYSNTYNLITESTQDLGILIPSLITTNSTHTSSTNGVFGFGEIDWSRNENSIYYLDDSESRLANMLDTINYVIQSLHDSLAVLDDIEALGNIVNARRINVLQGIPVVNIPSLLIDRAYQYSDGTLWVRLLNEQDSSYYDDFYYHYEVYNGNYSAIDIARDPNISNNAPFTGLEPIYDQGEIHYLNLDLIIAGKNYNVLFSAARPVGNANKIPAVELSDVRGSNEYPLGQTCEDLKYERAMLTAQLNYTEYLEGLKDTFKLNYTNFCLNQGTTPSMTNQHLNMTYLSTERQFTLYYYDQADNLVMTVPPGGVDTNFVYDQTTENAILNYRIDASGTVPAVLPDHSKKTTYRYNANNQIIEQTTPNGGTSNFWYDATDRLVLSQNAEQNDKNKYAYTFYDEQSRIVESGEVTLDILSGNSNEQIQAIITLGILNGQTIQFDSIIELQTRNDVVKTYYDAPVFTTATLDFTQKNLRSRVVTQAYYHSFNNTTIVSNWDYATHYSYDPTGNVTTLLNDYYQQGVLTDEYQRFKRIDYAFDVVSGNVLQVYYQTGLEDAFYHRYEYDAENRIVKVETSRDGLIWDEDATYDYYLHGPLARTVLGNQKVQGIDYAYTLEGWLKSINGGHKNADMGNDDDKDNIYGADAFGMALQYNQFDYTPIGPSAADLLVSANTGTTSNSDLYNGNISAITQHNQQLNYGKMYKYDQLNRLKSMHEHSIDETSGNALNWGNELANGNASAYFYDPNGNLTQLDRFDGVSGQKMDEFKYNYKSGTDQLDFVEDTVDRVAFPNDIDGQNSNNYTYDQIGNLVSDSSENICQIQWYPNGKVKRIIRDYPLPEKANLYFEYDGLGNRIKKSASYMEDGKLYMRTTYYVRDAQGNIMATYRERDCDLYGGEDSSGVYLYQYSNNYRGYTTTAETQASSIDILTFLKDNFSYKEELLAEATTVLNQVPDIKPVIMSNLVVGDYFTLYPDARDRVLAQDAYTYANDLFVNNNTAFIDLMNNKGEVWVAYYQLDAVPIDFYNGLNSSYATAYGINNHVADYYATYKQIATDFLNDDAFMAALMDVSPDAYTDIGYMRNNSAYAVSRMKTHLEQLMNSLAIGQAGGSTPLNINKINAALYAVNYSQNDLAVLFDGIDLTHFYNALNWMIPTSTARKRLNNLLHHFHSMGGGYIDASQLQQYEPESSYDYTVDTDGDLLPYFIHTDVANNQVHNGVLSVLSNLDLNQGHLYFENTEVRPYIINKMIENGDHAIIDNNLTTLSEETKNNLNLTENLNQLTHYFNVYFADKVLEANYNFDYLNTALSNVDHLTPVAYAAELENGLAGVDLGDLSTCSSNDTYLLAEEFTIFGSKRLGVMDAMVQRKDSTTNNYSRKLGATKYELSDHLGNVVAVVSDKKIHPSELLVVNGQSVGNLGYQADVLQRYDYYPFGMETDNKHTTIAPGLVASYYWNFDTTADELHGSGILVDANTTIPAAGREGSGAIETNYNDYVEYSDDPALDFGANDFTIAVWANKQSQLPRGNVVVGKWNSGGATSGQNEWILAHNGGVNGQNPPAFVIEIGDVRYTARSSADPLNQNEWYLLVGKRKGEYIYLYINGEIAASMHVGTGAINNVPGRTMQIGRIKPSNSFYSHMLVDELQIFNRALTDEEIYSIYSGVQLPVEEEKVAYSYGFQGHERLDEVSGSGNHISFGDYGYDSRLGRRWNQDPVVKDHESPYAAFGNSPIYLLDPSGEDTLVMHRSAVADEYSSEKSVIYKVTFSVIIDGVETNLNRTMYMMGNAEHVAKGENGLPDKTYVLEFDQMSNHNGDEGWENTIRVTDFGVFVHPGSYFYSFAGCYGLSCDEPDVYRDEETGDKTSTAIYNTGKALESVRDLYEAVDGGGNLTGDKFILQTNSEAPDGAPPVDNSLKGNPKTPK